MLAKCFQVYLDKEIHINIKTQQLHFGKMFGGYTFLTRYFGKIETNKTIKGSY